MKNNKTIIALVAILLGSVASIGAMGPISRIVAREAARKARFPRINITDEDGHTLLYDAIKDSASKAEIKKLQSKGAELNDRDIYNLGHRSYLAFSLNMSKIIDASAQKTVKVFNSLMTKFSDSKLDARVAAGKMTPAQSEQRKARRETIENIFHNANSGEGLLAAREEERLASKITKFVKRTDIK